MALVNLNTQLKSLKYGHDRPGGGSSNQPYITEDINQASSPPTPDFLWRGNALEASAQDTSRLIKFFTDLKSPAGALFAAKQNVLSRVGVQVQGPVTGIPRPPYNPANTILQAGSAAFGEHFQLLGNPTKREGYADEYKKLGTKHSPLATLQASSSKARDLGPQPTILTYLGGPGSTLGVGVTSINFATDNQGAILRTNTPWRGNEHQDSSSRVIKTLNSDTKKPLGLSNKLDSASYGTTEYLVNASGSSYTLNSNDTQLVVIPKDTYTLSGQQLLQQSSSIQQIHIQDFRQTLRNSNKNGPESAMALANSVDYVKYAIEKRVHLGDPGDRTRSRRNYVAASSSLDTINSMEMYNSEAVIGGSQKNDLVKFRIAAINNDNTGKKVFMHFRAFIDSFQDQYNATWSPSKYVGRGEDFFTYAGFTRTISLGWTVYAQSKGELIPMFKKLNYLATNLAPDYSDAGYMRGPLVQMTVGGYLYEQPGFITNLSYDIPQESTWEIGVGQEGMKEDPTLLTNDTSVKELPHMIKVSCQFTPIHEFVPSKGKLIWGTEEGNPKNGVPTQHDPNWVRQSGSRFIALSDVGHIAKDEDTNYNIVNTKS